MASQINMNSRRRWLWLFLLWASSWWCAAQAPAGLQLETAPLGLELTSCEDGARLLVIARNSSPTDNVSDAEVKFFADVPVKTAPESVTAKILKPNENISWEVNVTCTAGFDTGALQVMLASKLHHGGNELNQISTKPVTLKLRAPESFDSIAAIDVKSTLESLTGSEKGELKVAITNKTVRPIQLSIKPNGPEFINIDPEEKKGITIPPLRSEVVPFAVSTKGRVRPGKQLLLFQVELKLDGRPRDFMVTREVTVGVLGESQILNLLGVPSLLFLPGFLAVSSFLAFWRMRILRPAGAATFPLEEKSSAFWLLSITASMIISGVLIWRRGDFFSFYGLLDLIELWSISIALGGAVYFSWRLIVNLKLKATYPMLTDTPEQVLQKLAAQKMTMDFPRTKIKGLAQPAFLLMWHAFGSKAFFSPQMVLVWQERADANLRTTVQAQLTRGGSVSIVADILEKEIKKLKGNQPSNIKSFEWDKSDPLNSRPHEVEEDKFEGNVDVEIILREE